MDDKTRRALVRALSRNQSTAQPTTPQPSAFPAPSPTVPHGMVSYSDFWWALATAAFGSVIRDETFRAFARRDRLKVALDRYEAQERERVAMSGRSKLTGGLLGLGLLSLPNEAESEPAKVVRVREHISRLEAEALAHLGRLVEAQRSALGLIRALGAADALHAYTVDHAGNLRRIRPEAWGNAENWERLMRERVFRAGAAFDPAGVPCFPVATVNALSAFIAEHGEAGLGDIAGATRAVGAPPPHPPQRRLSAVEWFRAIGQAEIRADLTARKELTEGAVYREAAKRWNEMPADKKSERAQGTVSAGAFKKANTRTPKRGARGAD